MKPRYVLLQVDRSDSSLYKYAPLDFSFEYGLLDCYMVFNTRARASAHVRKLNEEGARWPVLYGIAPYKWDWDRLSNHPDYASYLDNVKEWKKELRRRAKLPAKQRETLPPAPKPTPPAGTANTISITPSATPPPPFNSASQSYVNSQGMSTSDDYNRLALLVTKLELSIGSLRTEFMMLAEACDDEAEAQKKAIVALGAIIKGMDDRIEDLEHPTTNKETS